MSRVALRIFVTIKKSRWERRRLLRPWPYPDRAGVAGLIVLDVSDPAKPIEVSRLTLNERYPMPHWLAADRTSGRLVVTGDGRTSIVQWVRSDIARYAKRHHARMRKPGTIADMQMIDDRSGCGTVPTARSSRIPPATAREGWYRQRHRSGCPARPRHGAPTN